MCLERPAIPYPLIDGGVFANNPALCAYAEARNLQNDLTARDMFILCLGTGKINKPYHYKDARNWGLVEWVKPVLDIIMSGVAETVDYQLDQIFTAAGKPEQYVRIEPDLLDASPEMDEASIDNLNALRVSGQICAEENDDLLDAVAERLLAMA